jgi:hypothetical protein
MPAKTVAEQQIPSEKEKINITQISHQLKKYNLKIWLLQQIYIHTGN